MQNIFFFATENPKLEMILLNGNIKASKTTANDELNDCI